VESDVQLEGIESRSPLPNRLSSDESPEFPEKETIASLSHMLFEIGELILVYLGLI